VEVLYASNNDTSTGFMLLLSTNYSIVEVVEIVEIFTDFTSYSEKGFIGGTE
jgi:hypothetical protein